MQQLPLDIALAESARFENYITGANTVALGLCKQMASAEGDAQIYLWGAESSGKSHLLQATCSLASQNNITATYLPLGELLAYGPALLDGMEQLGVVCIDDVHVCKGREDWEVGLFKLINACRLSGARLLISGCTVASDIGLNLQDLSSRLSWGAVVQLEELGDKDRRNWLRQLSQDKGLPMTEELADYVLSHCPRDMAYLTRLLKELDVTSLSQKRKLSVALVKQAQEALNFKSC